MFSMRRKVFTLALFLWIGGTSYVMATMSGLHSISFLPDISIAKNVFTSSSNNKWTMTHVISEGCKCSSVVLQYLQSRQARADVNENVIVVGKISETEMKNLLANKYKVAFKTAQDMDQSIAGGVPFLMITSNKGEALYSGGYNQSKVNSVSDIHDLEILDSYKNGKSIASLPIFGCAVTAKFQHMMDPLGIKYTQKE